MFNYKRKSRIFFIVLMLFSFITACTVGTNSKNEIAIDGSSTVFPITQAVAEEFHKKNPSAEISVGVSGTGGGMKKFCSGELDIANASRPIKDEELKSCEEKKIEFIELPIALDGAAIVVNKKNNFVECLSIEDLKKMWSPDATDKVMTWKQVNQEFPDRPLKLYGPGTDSGTFDYFTNAVNGKSKASRTDYTPSENDDVIAKGVMGEPNALGYFGVAYYEQNKDNLKLVGIRSPEGKCEKPIPLENVVKNIYKPLSRPLFIYVSAKALKDKPEVKKFAKYYLDNTAKLAKDSGYIGLPAQDNEKVKQKLAASEVGSKFKDAKPGDPVEKYL
jgi:phosphate transport system substrate-binding protein